MFETSRGQERLAGTTQIIATAVVPHAYEVI